MYHVHARPKTFQDIVETLYGLSKQNIELVELVFNSVQLDDTLNSLLTSVLYEIDNCPDTTELEEYMTTLLFPGKKRKHK